MRTLLTLLLLLGIATVSASDVTVGWRGDGSGKYPTSEPPTTWSQVSKSIQGLRFQAKKPKGAGAEGTTMPDGVIREWLVLGPVALPEGGTVQKDTLPDEAQLFPDENDKGGELSWKKITTETDWIEFIPALGKPTKGVAFAFTNIYSESGGAFRMNFTELAGTRIILNGKPLPPNGSGSRYKVDLVKGWNRLLLKIAPRDTDWACGVLLHAWQSPQYEKTNIVWVANIPGAYPGFYGGGMGCGAPIIVKDRIYLLSEPHDLICLNKADGKILWVRTCSYFDAASDEDKKNPAYKEAEPIAAKLAEINNSVPTAPLGPKYDEKMKLEHELYAKMQAIDAKRYKRPVISDCGYAGFTPVSDGQFIYAWFGTGTSACFDLDGNRKWIRVDNIPNFEHGISSSPILADGKLIVFLRDLIAIDAKTGSVAWQIPLISRQGDNPDGYFHGTPLSISIAGTTQLVMGNGSIVRAGDGKVLYKNAAMGKQSICSPVADKGMLFEMNTSGYSPVAQFFLQKIPDAAAETLNPATRTVGVDTGVFPKYFLGWHMSSPIIHDGLAYLLNSSGGLSVVDVAEGRVLYQKLLDVDHFQWCNEAAARGIGSSPVLAGKYLYFLGNSGGAVVIEPGRTFKQVAKNKIENTVQVGHWSERQERFVANPVPDGKRLYIRGEANLYAIGQ
jgi:outer membrane protein assembly factor BamB